MYPELLTDRLTIPQEASERQRVQFVPPRSKRKAVASIGVSQVSSSLRVRCKLMHASTQR